MGSWLTVPIPPKTGSHDPAVTNVTRTQLEIVTGAGGRVFSIFRKRVERAELLASEQRARGNGERATCTYLRAAAARDVAGARARAPARRLLAP